MSKVKLQPCGNCECVICVEEKHTRDKHYLECKCDWCKHSDQVSAAQGFYSGDPGDECDCCSCVPREEEE